MHFRNEIAALREFVFMTFRYWYLLVPSGLASVAYLFDISLGPISARVQRAVAAVCWMGAVFLAFRAMRTQRDKLRFRYGPRLKPVRHYSDCRLISFGGGSPQIRYLCLHVDFENDPEIPDSNATTSVIARVTWMEGEQQVLTMDGRWGDSEQPPMLKPLAPTLQLKMADFGIGVKRELNLAVRPEHLTKGFYAFNNENYSYPGWRKPEHMLTGTNYTVVVRLRGKGVDGRYTFSVTHASGGVGIELVSSEPTPCLAERITERR